MRYRGIIFDLDGVICSTDKYHYQAWKEMADKLGIYFDENINNRLRGVSRMDSLEIILENYNLALSVKEKEDLAKQKNDIYVMLLNQMSEKDLTLEVKQTLDELRKRGCLLAIGSSSKNAKRILEKLGLSNYFDGVSDGTNIIRSKPDPEVFCKAADILRLTPKECLVVEDAKAGIDAAVAGGFDSAGLSEAADYNKTVYPLKNFKDLLQVVENGEVGRND